MTLDWIRRPRGLRWTVAALVGAAIMLVVAAAAQHDPSSSVVWWALLVIVAFLWQLARTHTRAVAESGAKSLDERDLMLRNSAAWWGQSGALISGTGFAVVLALAAKADPVDASEFLDRAGVILLSLMILAALVPTAYIATLMSDEDNNEDED